MGVGYNPPSGSFGTSCVGTRASTTYSGVLPVAGMDAFTCIGAAVAANPKKKVVRLMLGGPSAHNGEVNSNTMTSPNLSADLIPIVPRPPLVTTNPSASAPSL